MVSMVPSSLLKNLVMKVCFGGTCEGGVFEHIRKSLLGWCSSLLLAGLVLGLQSALHNMSEIFGSPVCSEDSMFVNERGVSAFTQEAPVFFDQGLECIVMGMVVGHQYFGGWVIRL